MNANLYAIISLIALVLAVGLGFAKDLNTGIVAVALALIVGRFAGMTDAQIIAGFPTTTFVRVLGPMLFFSVANNNGSIDWLARKSLTRISKHVRLFPIVIYIMSGIISGLGPGTIATPAIMSVIALNIAHTMHVSPLLFGLLAVFGTYAGGISPFTSAGIIGINLGKDINIPVQAFPYYLHSWIAISVFCFILYFVLGGFKLKSDIQLRSTDLPPLNREQIYTIFLTIVMLVAVMIFKVDVGLACFAVAALIFALGADQLKAIAKVPWRTLIMFSGFNLLMNVVLKTGGVDIMSSALASIMNETTAPFVMGMTAGLMSLFSTASAVVMPTLIPAIPNIIQNVGGNISPYVMLVAVTTSSFSAAVSPLSLGGSLLQAAYAQAFDPPPAENRIIWRRQMIIALCGIVVVSIVSITGVYNFFV
jgi:di/tricarboxylate transporter